MYDKRDLSRWKR